MREMLCSCVRITKMDDGDRERKVRWVSERERERERERETERVLCLRRFQNLMEPPMRRGLSLEVKEWKQTKVRMRER